MQAITTKARTATMIVCSREKLMWIWDATSTHSRELWAALLHSYDPDGYR
jgi:hypothetical protein